MSALTHAGQESLELRPKGGRMPPFFVYRKNTAPLTSQTQFQYKHTHDHRRTRSLLRLITIKTQMTKSNHTAVIST